MPAMPAARSSSIGSTAAECAAPRTFSGQALRPSDSTYRTSSPSWSPSIEPTVSVEGDAWTHTVTSGNRSATRANSSSASSTTAMPPVLTFSRSSSSRERTAITRTPSATPSAPATTAALISPIELPTTAAGRAPYDRQSAASATCMPNSATCVAATPSAGEPVATSSRSENPASRRTCGSSSSIAAANAGSSASSRRPIPAHCEPMPLNTQTAPDVSGRSRPVRGTAGRTTVPGAGSSPAACRRRASARASRPRAATTAQAGRRSRRRARVCATSPQRDDGAGVGAGEPGRERAGLGRGPARRWPPESSRAATSSPGSRAPGATATCAGAGHSSRMTCALVPPKPKPETPARAHAGVPRPRPRLGDDVEPPVVEPDVRVGRA